VVLTILCHRKGGWRIWALVIARERHAHHSCTSFVSRTKAFTTSYLLETVGAALSGSARGDPRRTMCVSLTGPLSAVCGRSYRGWLVSVLSASKAKIHPHQLEKLEPHFIVLYFAPQEYISLPKHQLSSFIADLRFCELRPRYGPRLTTRNSAVPQAHMRALVCERAVDPISPITSLLRPSTGYASRVLAVMESNDP
jgi:hypothetical protein